MRLMSGRSRKGMARRRSNTGHYSKGRDITLIGIGGKENPMDEPKEEKKDKFCRLCGKNKPMGDICDIMLASDPSRGKAIIYKGCKDCAVVIHNASFLIKEVLQVEAKRRVEEMKARGETLGSNIIIPKVLVPRNLKN
jgi:hypothetical protein